MNSRYLTDQLKAEAHRLGFFACGVAKAEPVKAAYATFFRDSLQQHEFADMHYMYEHTDKRLDPRLLMPGVKSIVSVALNYAPARSLPTDEYQIAAYALGKDYHDVVKRKLFQLVAALPAIAQGAYRCFVDTAPVLERYWAQQAGLGWIGRSHQLIIPKAGSQFFLGELFTDVELAYDSPMHSHCGRCHKCVDACPTGALLPAEESAALPICHLDSHRCISYQTIENRGEIATEVKEKLGNHIYGCDECIKACPWNRFSTPTDVADFQANDALLAMKKADWQQLTEAEYRLLFKGSAVKRAKYSGLKRNIDAAAEASNKGHEAKSE